MADQSRLRLALDHNFPTPILALLDRYLPDLDLVPVRTIDHRMPDLGDRELILALHQAGWPALVTSNYKMLRNPKELAAILRTKLTVVAVEGVGGEGHRCRADVAGSVATPGEWGQPSCEPFVADVDVTARQRTQAAVRRRFNKRGARG